MNFGNPTLWPPASSLRDWAFPGLLTFPSCPVKTCINLIALYSSIKGVAALFPLHMPNVMNPFCTGCITKKSAKSILLSLLSKLAQEAIPMPSHTLVKPFIILKAISRFYSSSSFSSLSLSFSLLPITRPRLRKANATVKKLDGSQFWALGCLLTASGWLESIQAIMAPLAP